MDIPQGHTRVQGGGDERVAQGVRCDTILTADPDDIRMLAVSSRVRPASP
jgi:hypothetical protein